MKEICQLNDIEDGQGKAFAHPTLANRTFFIVRQNQQAWAYLNMCPHMGVAMEFQENKFMSFDGTQIQCAMHGALFDISTGFCSWGPCSGQSLMSIEMVNNNGALFFKQDESENEV